MATDEINGRTPLIDTSVHIFFKNNTDLRDHLREPFKSRGLPDAEGDWYGTPGGDYAPDTNGPGGVHPGSDPDFVGERLFVQDGVDIAILHPMTRGILPDRFLTSAVLAAHNEMMVARWLESGKFADRYRGTIRVNPEDLPGALREIERWKDHPQVVQLGIPLQSRETYGKPQFWPLWEAAEAAGLPVAVHIEMGTSIANPPTPSGHTRTYEQYASFMPLNYIYHLMGMITEGVFERFPNLKMVWADGGADLLTPFIWRMDSFGRPHLEQTPHAPKMPSDYLPEHVYFVQGSLDAAGEPEYADQWAGFTGKDNMVMFGSSYPDWQLNSPSLLSPGLTPEQREKVLWRNAAELYGIDIFAATAAR